MYYNGYPIVPGQINKSTLIAKCPYCGKIEHFNWSKSCGNPSRRMSHCKDELIQDYYYIHTPNVKGGERDE
jgi:sarcosine oxidase delta subunit